MHVWDRCLHLDIIHSLVTQIYNPNTEETETGGFLGTASSQSGLISELQTTQRCSLINRAWCSLGQYPQQRACMFQCPHEHTWTIVILILVTSFLVYQRYSLAQSFKCRVPRESKTVWTHMSDVKEELEYDDSELQHRNIWVKNIWELKCVCFSGIQWSYIIMWYLSGLFCDIG